MKISIPISEKIGAVSAILTESKATTHLLILAHGAGAGMSHPFMEQLSQALLAQNIACLRFNFSYMEKGSRRPDSPKIAHEVIREVIKYAEQVAKGKPIFGAGKSFGGRMFSQLLSKEKIPVIKGLVFYGFPLHPIAKVGIERADHLSDVKQKMLFLQGTRDALAQKELIQDVCSTLKKATLHFSKEETTLLKCLREVGKPKKKP